MQRIGFFVTFHFQAPMKKPIKKSISKNGNRKKTPRKTNTKRRRKSTKKVASKKTTRKRATKKEALVQETYRLLKEYANRSSKGNKGTRKKSKKRTVQKSNKSTSKKTTLQKLKEENKRLRKALKNQQYKPPVFESSPLDDLDETIRLLSEYTGVSEVEIREEVPELGIADVEPPIFNTSDRSILRIEFTVKDYDLKIQQVSHLDQKTLNIYRLRDKLFPRAFMPMLEITYRGQSIVRANRMSPPGMNTTLFEIVTYCQEFMEDFKTSYFEYLNDHPDFEIDEDDTESQNENSSWVFDPNNVTAILIRFIYAPSENDNKNKP